MEVLGAISAPPLLQIAYTYLTIAWKQYCIVQGQREQCHLLITRCQDLLLEILKIVGEGDCPPSMQSNVDVLESACLTVKETVSHIASKGFAWRLLNQDKMDQSIAAAEASVTDALACFNLGAHLSAQKLQLEINDARSRDHDELIGHLETLAQNDQKILNALQNDERGRHRLEELVVALTKHVRNITVPANGTSKEPTEAFILTASATLQRLSGRPAPEIPHWSVTSLEVNFDAEDESTCIGRGGFGKIYMGEWNGQVVAVKEMYSEDAKLLDRQNMKSIIHEIKIWSRLAHPHVLPFYCACLESTRPFMVSRFCQNGNALEFLRKYPQADRILVLHEISLGLVYLHSQSIIHSDLKASNILIGDDAKALIADFGLSHLQEQAANGATRTMASAQRLNGTLRWMAPELLDGEKLEKPSDVYSYALVAWELFTGNVPYSHIPERAFARRVVDKQERPERPESLTNDLLWDLMQQCWQPEPADRPVVSAIQARLRPYTLRVQSPVQSVFGIPSTPTISSRLSGHSTSPTVGTSSSTSTAVETSGTSPTSSAKDLPSASLSPPPSPFPVSPKAPAIYQSTPNAENQTLESGSPGPPGQPTSPTPSITIVEELSIPQEDTLEDMYQQAENLLEVLGSPTPQEKHSVLCAGSPNLDGSRQATGLPLRRTRSNDGSAPNTSSYDPGARARDVLQEAKADRVASKVSEQYTYRFETQRPIVPRLPMHPPSVPGQRPDPPTRPPPPPPPPPASSLRSWSRSQADDQSPVVRPAGRPSHPSTEVGRAWAPLDVKKIGRPPVPPQAKRRKAGALSSAGASHSWVPSGLGNELTQIRRLQYYLMPMPPENGSNSITAIAINKNWMATSISTGAVLIFETETGKLLRNITLDKCQDPVVALVSSRPSLDTDTTSKAASARRRLVPLNTGDKLVVAGSDHHVRVYNPSTGACLHTLKGHSKPVLCIKVVGQLVFTGSVDESIRIWDLSLELPEKKCRVLDRHIYRVLCLDTWKDWLVSGSQDKTVRLWNFEGNKDSQTEVFRGHSAAVICVAIEDTTIVSASADQSVIIWSRTYRTKHRTVSLCFVPSCLALDILHSSVFVGTTAGVTMKLSLFTEGGSQKWGTCHDSGILSLILRGSCIVTGSASGEVQAFECSADTLVCEPGVTDGGDSQAAKTSATEPTDASARANNASSSKTTAGESKSLYRFAYGESRWVFMRNMEGRLRMEIWAEEHSLESL
ncbi:hypothetical protein HGRIS_005266 [Hohenbuehelia grisea]|uniref:Protein kinase domain-containing protein n=1 Tax=Hohenbuehelia grisea TaxID=104357 RepID=A0ABR3JEI5_9AGAR